MLLSVLSVIAIVAMGAVPAWSSPGIDEGNHRPLIPLEVRENQARLLEVSGRLESANLVALGIPLAGYYLDPRAGVIRVGLTELKDEYTEPIKAIVNKVDGVTLEFFEARFTEAKLRSLQRKIEEVFFGVSLTDMEKLMAIHDDALREEMRGEFRERGERARVERVAPVIGVGVDIWNNGLSIRLREIRPEHIEAVRRVVGNEVPIKFEEGGVELFTTQQCVHRPLVGGIQIRTNDGLSTLGFRATRFWEAEAGFVMTGHMGWWGAIVWQPTWPWWNLARTLNRVGEIRGNPTGPRYSDAAFVRLYAGVGVLPRIWVGVCIRTGVNLHDDIVGWRSSATVPLGTTVNKQGITTGFTSGFLLDRGQTVAHPVFGTLFNQSRVWNMGAAHGDSGAPVFIHLWRVELAGIL